MQVGLYKFFLDLATFFGSKCTEKIKKLSYLFLAEYLVLRCFLVLSEGELFTSSAWLAVSKIFQQTLLNVNKYFTNNKYLYLWEEKKSIFPAVCLLWYFYKVDKYLLILSFNLCHLFKKIWHFVIVVAFVLPWTFLKSFSQWSKSFRSSDQHLNVLPQLNQVELTAV